MNSIKKFWNSGIAGKVVIASVGLLVLCCVCSIPIAIFNPSTPTPPTTEIVSSPTQVEIPTETISPINTLEPTNTSEPIMTETLQQSTSEVACTFCNLECPASQGGSDFCLADPKLVADQTLFEETLKTYCDFKGGDFCEVLVWTDVQYVPSSFPMTDDQLNNEVADYTRNKNTGYDCFTLLSVGNVVYQSEGCN